MSQRRGRSALSTDHHSRLAGYFNVTLYTQWKEMGLAGREWCIPPEWMNTDRKHRAPLSIRALALLREAREFANGLAMVFPSPRGRPLNEVAISKLVRELGFGAVPHGFRSSFRDWAAERSNAPREDFEPALAHVNANAIEAAYRRSDLFERRRPLMEQWSAFLAGPASSSLPVGLAVGK